MKRPEVPEKLFVDGPTGYTVMLQRVSNAVSGLVDRTVWMEDVVQSLVYRLQELTWDKHGKGCKCANCEAEKAKKQKPDKPCQRCVDYLPDLSDTCTLCIERGKDKPLWREK